MKGQHVAFPAVEQEISLVFFQQGACPVHEITWTDGLIDMVVACGRAATTSTLVRLPVGESGVFGFDDWLGDPKVKTTGLFSPSGLLSSKQHIAVGPLARWRWSSFLEASVHFEALPVDPTMTSPTSPHVPPLFCRTESTSHLAPRSSAEIDRALGFRVGFVRSTCRSSPLRLGSVLSNLLLVLGMAIFCAWAWRQGLAKGPVGSSHSGGSCLASV